MHPAVAQSSLVQKGESLKPYVVGSVAGHVAVLGLLLIFNYLRRPPSIDLNQKPIKASLVRLGKARDEKLLPRKEEPPAAQTPKPEPTAPPPAPNEKPAAAVPVAIPGTKPSSQKSSSAADSAARRRALFGAFAKSGAASHAEEPEGAEDGDPNGDSATQEGERYWGMLKAAVVRHYDVSATITEQERLHLKALVSLRIGKDGHLIGAEFAQRSGNSLFDDAVMAAVKRAQPFTPPPEHLKAQLAGGGVTLEFTP